MLPRLSFVILLTCIFATIVTPAKDFAVKSHVSPEFKSLLMKGYFQVIEAHFMSDEGKENLKDQIQFLLSRDYYSQTELNDILETIHTQMPANYITGDFRKLHDFIVKLTENRETKLKNLRWVLQRLKANHTHRYETIPKRSASLLKKLITKGYYQALRYNISSGSKGDLLDTLSSYGTREYYTYSDIEGLLNITTLYFPEEDVSDRDIGKLKRLLRTIQKGKQMGIKYPDELEQIKTNHKRTSKRKVERLKSALIKAYYSLNIVEPNHNVSAEDKKILKEAFSYMFINPKITYDDVAELLESIHDNFLRKNYHLNGDMKYLYHFLIDILSKSRHSSKTEILRKLRLERFHGFKDRLRSETVQL